MTKKKSNALFLLEILMLYFHFFNLIRKFRMTFQMIIFSSLSVLQTILDRRRNKTDMKQVLLKKADIS